MPRRAAARSPGEVDRGPLGVAHRHPPGPRRDLRGRGRLRPRRAPAGPAHPAVRNGGGYLTLFGAGPLFTWPGCCPGPIRGRPCAPRPRSSPPTRPHRRLPRVRPDPGGVHLRARGRPRGPRPRPRPGRRAPGQHAPARAAALHHPLVPVTYDNGDYAPRSTGPRRSPRLARAARRRPPPRHRLRRYVQMAGVGPSEGNPYIGLDIGSWESAMVRMEPDGTVRLVVGASPTARVTRRPSPSSSPTASASSPTTSS